MSMRAPPVACRHVEGERTRTRGGGVRTDHSGEAAEDLTESLVDELGNNGLESADEVVELVEEVESSADGSNDA